MYTIGEILHQDSQGTLCRGINAADGAAVLLRVAPENFRPEHVEHLRKDFRIGAHLATLSIARPVALDTCDGRPALRLTDFSGEPLERHLGEPLPLPTFFRLAIAIGAAVGEIHRCEIIHKALEPANILIHPESGDVRIADFGHAERLPCPHQGANSAAVSESMRAYMSPEQTGRTNRAPDRRSDLYSLGVVFYRMLTGRLPFDAGDALEWVYCHIARLPASPKDHVASLPSPLAAIVMKLLAKEPEERYQGADGLLHDLRHCLTAWQRHADIAHFELGRQDVPDHFQLPQRLYGRQEEIRLLRDAFERVVESGRPELVLVSGYSGMGKSSLVNELYKPIIRERGFFAAGKFDQFKRDIPYATIVQAFADLVQGLLAESDERIADWKQRLQEALGANAQLIVDVIPAVGLIIGAQPPVPALPPAEVRNRFRFTFRQFIGVFTRKNHPLVLFLDDLQWADAASVELLQDLLSQSQTRSFLPVCAYRDNEVGATHPFHGAIDALRRSGTPVTDVVLDQLGDAALEELLADALHRRVQDVAPLAQLVREKTGGNPFFAIQFLSTLHEEKLVRFDAALPGWRWDIARIRAQGFTDNIAAFMAGKLARLPVQTQRALQCFACLGTSAGVPMLALALRTDDALVHAVLADAVQAGLVYRLGDRYKFLHDRVQEAAYVMVGQNKAALHAQIGRAFLHRMEASERDEHLFDVVNQLNQGLALIDSGAEREQVRRLNLQAGKKAKASIAFAAACQYLGRAAALLPEDAWQHCYDDAFAIQVELAECEYLAGDTARAETRFAAMLAHVASDADRARIHGLRLNLFQAAGRFEEGVEAGLQALALFGIALPDEEALPTLQQAELARLMANLNKRHASELYDTPVATDERAIAAIGVLTDLMPCAFVARNRLYLLLLYKALNLSLDYGNTSKSCLAYGGYAVILAARHGDTAAGYAFSELALRLNEKFNDVRTRGPLLFLHGNYLNFWHKPYAENIQVMEAGFRACLEVGDMVWAGYSCYRTPWQLIEKGEPLDDVLNALRRYEAFALQSHNDAAHRTVHLEQRFVAALKGLTRDQGDFSGNGFDEAECMAAFERVNFRSGIAFHHVMKQVVCFMYRRYGDALDAADGAAQLHDVMLSMPIEATHCYYQALTVAALYTQVGHEQQARFLGVLQACRRRLKHWAENCPQNFLDRYALVEAEMARIEGRDLDAMQRYEQAIRLAEEQGYVHNLALGNELAAYFYRSRGSARSADSCLREAHSAYLRWGADGKVRQLESLYPQLQAREAPVAESGAKGMSQLDAIAVIKASQALSGEIALDRLLAKLLQVVIEQAGAQRGCVLLQNDGSLEIEAEAALDASGRMHATLLRGQRATNSDLLPFSVINYVSRTCQKLLLENASTDPRFSADPYILQRKPKSVLCQPIFRHAELAGLLYLENNLIAGAFSDDAQGVLELLASQAAISIDNARLYADLKEENAERRRIERELQLSEAHYRRLFETAKDGILLLRSSSGVVTDVNSYLLDMLGYSYEEFVGKKLWDIPPFRDVAVYRSVFGELQSKESVRHDALPLQARDGRVIDVEFVSSAYSIEEHRVVQCNVRDVTERRRAQERQDVQFAVTRLLAEASSLADAAPSLLQIICEKLDWEIGELWQADVQANRMHFISGWEAPAIAPSAFVAAGRTLTISAGEGLAGQVIANGQAYWLSGSALNASLRRSAEAAQIGLRGSFTFPLFVAGEAAYVLAFFCRQSRKPDADMINTLMSISSQVGQFIERKRTEQALVASEERYRSLTGLSSDWYWEQDENLRFTVMSDGLARVGGMDPGDVIGKTRGQLTADLQASDPDLWSRHQQALENRQPFYNLEYRSFGRDGQWHWFSISGEPLFDDQGRFRGYRGTGKEISERKQAEERISYMAHHDALTGLPNRTLLEDRIRQALAHAHRGGREVAVMFIDLDHFKHINDSLGHQVGDRLLQMVSGRLELCLRRGDSLARLGGDEFVVVLPEANDRAAGAVAEKILDQLKDAFLIDGHELHAGGSIGIALYPNDGNDADTLMRAADAAMYHAKAKGRGNYRFFTPGLNAAAQYRLAIVSQLRQAIGRGEFSLHYQPQIDIATGRMGSAEALLRWHQPERGAIAPNEFIPVAEETGLIVGIGEWVLREACRQLRIWRDSGHPELCVAVNLSARQLQQPGFAELVADILEQAGLPASALDLEITESVLMHPTEENMLPLVRLSEMGVQLSVDDFGTGYSSLSYLRRFPIHVLKIDQSFVRGIGQASNDAAIINAIIAMAHSLKLKVIAEGVETLEQATFLQAHDCLYAQGYYYSRPLPAERFAQLLGRQLPLLQA